MARINTQEMDGFEIIILSTKGHDGIAAAFLLREAADCVEGSPHKALWSLDLERHGEDNTDLILYLKTKVRA